MKTQDRTEIAEEVRQLCAQYQQEVPSRRRTWPRSIKDRVFRLIELGMSSEAIAKQTGVPVATIYSWKSVHIKSQGFLPVKVIPDQTIAVEPKSLPPKPKRRYKPRLAAPTITVVTPNGIRFEGLDVSAALQIAARLGLGS
jgi:transposase-like protein